MFSSPGLAGSQRRLPGAEGKSPAEAPGPGPTSPEAELTALDFSMGDPTCRLRSSHLPLGGGCYLLPDALGDGRGSAERGEGYPGVDSALLALFSGL